MMVEFNNSAVGYFTEVDVRSSGDNPLKHQICIQIIFLGNLSPRLAQLLHQISGKPVDEKGLIEYFTSTASKGSNE